MPSKPVTPKQILVGLAVLLITNIIVVCLGRGLITQVALLYPDQIPEHPYFVPGNAFLLYILVPIVVLSSLCLFLLPGVFTVLATGRRIGWAQVLPEAFGSSLLIYFLVTAALKLVGPAPVESAHVILVVCTAGVVTWGILAYRVTRGTVLPQLLTDEGERRRILWTVSIPLFTLVGLLPVVFWQDLHGDAFEALEIGRSLSHSILPRFPNPAGVMGIGVGMRPMAYPVHWFTVLLGPVETAARLPIFLYLPVLFCLLVAMIEWLSPRRLSVIEEALLVLALLIYTVTMSYSASYDCYFADIAAPTALETLTAICILATVYFLWTGNNVLFFGFALLSYLARPTGLLALCLFGLAIWITVPDRRKPWLLRVGLAATMCLCVGYLFDHVYLPAVFSNMDTGYTGRSSIQRLQYLTLDDWWRIGYVVVPCGIVPGLFLFLPHLQDRLTRSAALLSVLYFCFFYIQAFVALHHFVPAMLLPLVVFWRIYLHHPNWPKRIVLSTVMVAGVMALGLSMPRHFEINRVIRPIGQQISLTVGAYDSGDDSEFRLLLERYRLLERLFSPDWEVSDPAQELVTGYSSVIYYASQPKLPDAEINYILQPLLSDAPAGFTLIDSDEVAALYVRDLEQWEESRVRPLRTEYQSPIYDIPRAVLFKHWGTQLHKYNLNLKDVAYRIPIVATFMRRLFEPEG